MKKTWHIGCSAGRLRPDMNNPREVAFAERWIVENEQGNVLQHLVGRYSKRGAEVAATVVQWLGSNVGMSFLEEAIKRDPEAFKPWLDRLNRQA